MTNKELIQHVAKAADMSREDVQRLLDATVEVLSANMVDGLPTQIQGFGTFEVKQKNERLSVHPKTGVRTLTPPKMQVNFKVGTTLKEVLRDLGKDNPNQE